ncbi:MAG: SPFH domain-containing protein [Clostridia bacterium]|nr:SPFH domain-containing protein [Clostridia bacterium]
MALFLKILEWADDSKNTLVYKLPLKNGGRDVNQKSKLIVRESQKAIFVHKGQVCEVFDPGTYELKTEIFPILSRLAGWAYAFQTPISVDIYFINTKQFTGCNWGTSNPIVLRDTEFGMVRVRGYGSYSFKVDDAGIFLTELFGTNSSFKTDDITDWLKSILVSTITDTLGESKVSVLDLAANTLEFNELVKLNVQNKFKEIGLALTNFIIENTSVPHEVEKAIDERSKLGILGDKTDVMMKIAAAEAMKDAAKNEGMGGAFMGAGVGIGAGAGMGGVFADAFRSNTNAGSQDSGKTCPACGAKAPSSANFCPSCGGKLATKKFCTTCGKEISPDANFCPSCGAKQ